MMIHPIHRTLFVQNRGITHVMPTGEYHAQVDVLWRSCGLGDMSTSMAMLKSLNDLLLIHLFLPSRSVKPC